MRLLAALLALAVTAWPGDLEELRAGVKAIGKPGIPGPIACVGDKAFPVVGATLGDGTIHPVVAAATYGKGRVVAFGHGGYLGRRGPIVRNAIAWAGRGKPRVLDLRRPAPLVDADVVVWHGGPDVDVNALDAFVKRGGGLVVSGLVWGWRQLNPDKSLATDFALNRLLLPMGLLFCDGYTDKILPVATDVSGAHAGRALAAAPGHPQAISLVASAYRALPAGAAAFRAAVRKHVASLAADARLAVIVRHLDTLSLPPEKVRAEPTAATFPGALRRPAKARSADVRVDPAVPGWTSTGLWAPAGAVVRVASPVAGRYRVRIGCHTDTLWNKKTWRRHPEISRSWPLAKGETVVASAHGGLVYIEVPRGMKAEPFTVTIDGCVEAPLFVLGKTDPKRWRERIRHAPAPWAELAASKVILTVRAEDAVKLEDPTELLTFWDSVLDLYAELGRRPLDKRPQRFVPDRQISAGWLHAGYPIMMQLQHSKEIIDFAVLRSDDEKKSPGWGFWHELGHNHQHRDWTFGGTTEVTCNLFSLYVGHRVRGVEPARNAWALGQRARAKIYLKQPNFELWKRQPGVALWTYIPIQQGFGWELFQRVFEEYAGLPAHERPKTDADKRDQWMVRLSRAAKRDFGPYFETWGIPISEKARESVAGLKVWLPKFVK